jgi:hypothetical protein
MSEPQKEAFRKYLESAGAIDALTSGKLLQLRAVALPAAAVARASAGSRGASTAHDLPIIHAAVLVNLYEEPDKPKSAVE